METHRHTKDWLANLASSTQLCKKNMRKNQPWRCLCFGSALQITRMTPSRLTILQLRHNFLTEARTFIFTLRNFSGDQLSAVAFQVRLLQCRLILTGHHQSLHRAIKSIITTTTISSDSPTEVEQYFHCITELRDQADKGNITAPTFALPEFVKMTWPC